MRRKTKSRKAGLRFSVARIHKKLKRCTFTKRISVHAPVYLGAVLEYMTAEVLEIAGVVAKKYHHHEITPRHIHIAAKEDQEIEQLLEGVILSEGGVFQTEDQPKLSSQNGKKDKIKAKQVNKEKKRKLTDPGILHIGCPSSLDHSHKNKHEKRKESVKNRVDGKSSSFDKRISFQRYKSKADLSSLDGSRGDESSYIGQEFPSDDSSFKDHRGIGLAFRKNNKVVQTKISPEVKSSSLEKTAPLQKDRKEGGRNLSIQNNSFSQTRQSFSTTSAFLEENRESYNKVRNGSSSNFEEKERIKNNCQICPKYGNEDSSLSYQKQLNVGPENKNVLNSRDLQPKMHIPDPENFSTSNMSFADFVLKRSTIPPDLLNVSISGTYHRHGPNEDGCNIQTMSGDSDVKEGEISNKITGLNMKTAENGQTLEKNLISDSVKIGHNNKLKNVHMSMKKGIPNRVLIEDKENLTNLKVLPKLDSSEKLMYTSVRQNESESIVPRIYNRLKSLPQDYNNSSRSSFSEQSTSFPNTLERKTCRKSVQKYEIGDLVWGRFTESSFYPAIVINDPDGKFHSKIVSNNSGLSGLQYYLQFLYTSCDRAWIPSKQVMPYKGITKYEEVVKTDVNNMKMYKPETSSLKLQWRGAVLFAKKLEALARLERIKKCDQVKLKHFELEKNENKKTDFKEDLLNEGESNVDRLKETKKNEIIQKSKDQDLKRIQKVFKTNNITLNGNTVTDGISYSYSKRITNDFDKTEHFDNSSSQGKHEVRINEEENKKQNRRTLTTKKLELVNSKSEDEFPILGDLVWAQVPGFLHWPALVTRSVDGIFRRENNSHTQTMVHVQFFNCNGGTSWVHSLTRFVAVDQFQETERFTNGEVLQQWNKAVRDAEHTLGLTRKERLDEHSVAYDEL